jgi:hypothetical protein
MKKQIKKIKNMKNVFLAAVIAAALIFGIWYIWFRPTYDKYGLPIQNVSYEFVSSRPEAKLYYPGAKIFSPFGQPQRGTGTVAFSGAVMTSNDSPEKIYAWYHDWLLAHGWQEHTSFVHVATHVSTKDYVKQGQDREIFEVDMDDPKELSLVLGKPVPANITVFEFQYIIR